MAQSHSFLPNGTFTTNCEFDLFGVTQSQSTPSLHFGTGGMVESEGMQVTGRRGFYVAGDGQGVALEDKRELKGKDDFEANEDWDRAPSKVDIPQAALEKMEDDRLYGSLLTY